MSAAPTQPDGEGSAVRQVLTAAGAVAVAGAVAALGLFTSPHQRQDLHCPPRTDAADGDYSWAAAAAGGAVLTLALQALYRRLRKRGPASEYERTLVRDMDLLMQSGMYADVTFVVGDTEVKAHRAILAARRSSLGAMAINDYPEDSTRRVVIRDMEPDILKQLLVFLYTDVAQPDPQVAQKLLVAADRYNVYTLKEHCERVISQNLCVENAAECAALAVRHSCDCLTESSIRFIVAHFDDVMTTKGWSRVLRDYPYNAVTITSMVAAASLNTRWFR